MPQVCFSTADSSSRYKTDHLTAASQREADATQARDQGSPCTAMASTSALKDALMETEPNCGTDVGKKNLSFYFKQVQELTPFFSRRVM